MTLKLSKAGKHKLDQIKGLHRNTEKDLSQIMEEALDLFLQTYSPRPSSAKLRKKTIKPSLLLLRPLSGSEREGSVSIRDVKVCIF